MEEIAFETESSAFRRENKGGDEGQEQIWEADIDRRAVMVSHGWVGGG